LKKVLIASNNYDYLVVFLTDFACHNKKKLLITERNYQKLTEITPCNNDYRL